MKLAIPKFGFQNLSGEFKKGKFYILPDFFVELVIKDAVKKTGLVPFESLMDLRYFLIPYDYKEKKHNIDLIIVRTGGYGDVIALSSLINFLLENYLVNRVIFFTEKIEIVKYFSFYDKYINKRFFVAKLSEPLNSFQFLFDERTGELNQENIRYLIFEGIIERDKSMNWYELFYKTANIENISDDLKRPYLRNIFENDILENLKNKRKWITLTLSSTSYVRKFPYSLLSQRLLDEGFNLIIFYTHLSKSDRLYFKKFILNNKSFQNRLILLPFSFNFDEYLNILANSNLTISVDTLTPHFREGIRKPSINIFLSFPDIARANYYKYALNISEQTTCKHQPCFYHTKTKDEKCPKVKDKTNPLYIDFPPCALESEKIIIDKVFDSLIFLDKF